MSLILHRHVDAVDERPKLDRTSSPSKWDLFLCCSLQMKFLAQCAANIDAGVPADVVMHEMRERFTTLTCLNSKCSIVRSMCRPTEEYSHALTSALATVDDENVRRRVESIAMTGGRLHASDADEVCVIVRSLPPRLPENARALRLSRYEIRACKRSQVTHRIEKNKVRTLVDGRILLAHARSVVCDPTRCKGGIPELTLSLSLVTGRRECELLNGRSVFTPHTTHSLVFQGQAKKRDEGMVQRDERIIPCLSPSQEVVHCFAHLRARQRHVLLDNEAASRRYQSYLSRHMHTASPWRETGTHAHSLRGIYTCMCHALFDWGLHTDAYIAMCILGHTSLEESLVYTTFAIGGAFRVEEPPLGMGYLTSPPPYRQECDPTEELVP
jgi:hypothetical protein